MDGIVLAPLDDRALTRPVADAVREGIPVVIIDSALQGGDYTSFVATDNYKGGVLGARRLGGLLGGKGKIFLVRYQEGSASTMERERGFLDTVKAEFPGLTILVQDQYAGRHDGDGLPAGREPPRPLPGRRGHLHPQRIQHLRDAEGRPGIGDRRQGPVRRVRQLPQARRGAPARATSRASSSRIP